jgi:hypothetical protein
MRDEKIPLFESREDRFVRNPGCGGRQLLGDEPLERFNAEHLRGSSFWQALGLLVLSKLLFGGFRPYPRGGPRWRRRMMERWEQMTPEEREKFKQGMRHGCNLRQSGDAPNREAEVRA